MEETFTIPKIEGCQRCGETHTNIHAHKFDDRSVAIVIEGLTMTHWANCPTTGDPILINVKHTNQNEKPIS